MPAADPQAVTSPTNTSPGQDAAPNYQDLLAAAASQQSQTGSYDPWGLSYGMNAPVYSRHTSHKTVMEPMTGPIPVGTPRPEVPVVHEGAGFGPAKNPDGTPEQGNQYLQNFANFDPHTVSEWQAHLVNAGLLPAEQYRVGDGTDVNTMQAMAGVLRVAGLKQITPEAAMEYLLKHPDPSMSPAGKAKSAAKADAQAFQKAQFDAYRSQLASIYLKTWGINAPPGYVERAMAGHMNMYEFEAHERSKPAWMNSAAAQMERVSLNSNIAQMTGRVKF